MFGARCKESGQTTGRKSYVDEGGVGSPRYDSLGFAVFVVRTRGREGLDVWREGEGVWGKKVRGEGRGGREGVRVLFIYLFIFICSGCGDVSGLPSAALAP